MSTGARPDGGRSGRSGRSGKAGVALAGLASAGLLLVLGTRVWVESRIDTGIAVQPLSVTGQQAAAGVTGAALVLAAAVVVVLTARGWGRLVASGLLVLAALGAGLLAARVALDPAQAADAVASGLPGGVGQVLEVQATTVPWLAVLAAVPGLLAGVLALTRGGSWSGLSSRYDVPGGADAPTSGPAESRRGDPAQAWDRLSEGEDPTD